MKGVLAALIVVGCSHAQPVDPQGPDAGAAGDAANIPDAPTGVTCVDVGTSPIAIGTAAAADDYVLAFDGNAMSATSWGEAGNEAVVLDISGAQRGFIGHVILHQGAAVFGYRMHLGALAANEALTAKVSSLTAANAVHAARVCTAQLATVASFGAVAEGIANAPIYRWPIAKRFDDVPLLVGWSKSHKSYQAVMTNENGGTAQQCGGGADGMQAEIIRWGRSTDIESHYSYGGAAPSWERCTGRVDTTQTPLRMDGHHPILYYGDGHNRVFESRAGYGQACGTGAPEHADGALAGWDMQNTSNALADDAGKVIVLRPVPVEMDPLGYDQFGGRREGLADTYAPWVYRLASLELAREHKIDNAKTFSMARYLYVDVRVSDVGGSGDGVCSLLTNGGFVLRAVTSGGTVISSGQITSAYAGNGNHDWKRVAIALPANVAATDIDHFIFDAYDNDGIYVTAIGDAFIPVAAAANGATIDYVRHGTKSLAYYVDDDAGGCTAGVNNAGPNGSAYDCVGGQVAIAK